MLSNNATPLGPPYTNQHMWRELIGSEHADADKGFSQIVPEMCMDMSSPAQGPRKPITGAKPYKHHPYFHHYVVYLNALENLGPLIQIPGRKKLYWDGWCDDRIYV